ncbi:MAG TPA: hypothetical protein VGO92_00060 [Acidimicrobiales bacterium]|nr:hypothetical protein [Acidimicrobiales bacterium]
MTAGPDSSSNRNSQSEGTSGRNTSGSNAGGSNADGRNTRGRNADGSLPEPLEHLGLAPGEPVRFRRRPNERWHNGTAVARERDGSLAVRDGKGASRAIPLDLVEVKASGPRGAPKWEPLLDRAARIEQLRLL